MRLLLIFILFFMPICSMERRQKNKEKVSLASNQSGAKRELNAKTHFFGDLGILPDELIMKISKEAAEGQKFDPSNFMHWAMVAFCNPRQAYNNRIKFGGFKRVCRANCLDILDEDRILLGYSDAIDVFNLKNQKTSTLLEEGARDIKKITGNKFVFIPNKGPINVIKIFDIETNNLAEVLLGYDYSYRPQKIEVLNENTIIINWGSYFTIFDLLTKEFLYKAKNNNNITRRVFTEPKKQKHNNFLPAPGWGSPSPSLSREPKQVVKTTIYETRFCNTIKKINREYFYNETKGTVDLHKLKSISTITDEHRRIKIKHELAKLQRREKALIAKQQRKAAKEKEKARKRKEEHKRNAELKGAAIDQQELEIDQRERKLKEQEQQRIEKEKAEMQRRLEQERDRQRIAHEAEEKKSETRVQPEEERQRPAEVKTEEREIAKMDQEEVEDVPQAEVVEQTGEQSNNNRFDTIIDGITEAAILCGCLMGWL